MIIGRQSSVVRRQQLLERTSPPKLLAGFLPNLVGMILISPSLKIVQTVQVHSITRSHRLKYRMKTIKTFSETTRPRALIFNV